MKIATINDTHFGQKNDAQYMLDFQEKFYTQFFIPTLLKNDVKHVLHGGDMFDRRKYINFNTLYRTKKMFLDLLWEARITMDIIPGNHDVYAKNTNEINSLNELLRGYDNINVIEEPEVKTFDGVRILMLPWLNNENFKTWMDWVEQQTADVLYGHLELAGFEMYAGVKNEHGLSMEHFRKFPQVWSGHFHHQSKKGNIHYLGTPYELTQSDAGDPKGFHIFDTITKKLEFQKTPFTLYDTILYSDETDEDKAKFGIHDVSKYENKIVRLVVLKKKHPKLFENFVERLYKQNLIDLSIIEDHSGMNEENVEMSIQSSSTRELLEKYIDNSETDMDKSKLKNILNNLYIEAINTTNDPV